jgi:hypothetical protein
MKKMKPELLAITPLLIAFATQGNTKDLGIFNGEPTPALAMYAAQISFAADRCVAEGFTADAKGAASLVKYFDRVVQLRLYKKKDPDFVRNLESFLDNYSAAWNTADQDIRRNFCGGLNGEIAVKSEGFFRWITPVEYFRRKFSPLSLAAAERQRKLAGAASVMGVVATTAATVSAGHDAVSSAKVGDWFTSNQLMALSTGFNQLGWAFVGTSAIAPPESANAAASVLEEMRSDGTLRVVRCPVVDHFFSYSAPIDSPIWVTYQNVSVPCRDFVESDLEHVE